jgi:hypothetical protein
MFPSSEDYAEIRSPPGPVKRLFRVKNEKIFGAGFHARPVVERQSRAPSAIKPARWL